MGNALAFPQKANFTVPMKGGRKFTFCAGASTDDVYKDWCGSGNHR